MAQCPRLVRTGGLDNPSSHHAGTHRCRTRSSTVTCVITFAAAVCRRSHKELLTSAHNQANTEVIWSRRAPYSTAHALAKVYGAASCSYGNDPRRHVDLFRTDTTGFPSIRLSDAILAEQLAASSSSSTGGATVGTEGGGLLGLGDGGLLPEGARAARLGPAPGDSWSEGYTEHYSLGNWRRLEMRFTDVAGGAGGVDVVTGALREFSGEYALVGDALISASESITAVNHHGPRLLRCDVRVCLAMM